MRRIETPDGKVSLVIPDLLAEFGTLAASSDRDWFAGTPHHEHGRARSEKVAV